MRRDLRAYEDMHELLRKIRYADPNVSEADAREQLWEQLQAERQKYFRLLYDNWFEINWPRYRTIVKPGAVAVMKDENRKRKENRKKRALAVKQAVENIAALVLMNLPMPNGKLLRDCTGSDCLRFGGWYRDIGKAIGANEKVGKQLTENDLQNLYGRNQRRVA